MMTRRDRLYYEYVNSRFETWVYTDGERYYIPGLTRVTAIQNYASLHGYELVYVI